MSYIFSFCVDVTPQLRKFIHRGQARPIIALSFESGVAFFFERGFIMLMKQIHPFLDSRQNCKIEILPSFPRSEEILQVLPGGCTI
jgi:hypothetical protein